MADLTHDQILKMEAGPKLNALIATEVIGWTQNEKGFWFKPGKRHSWNFDALDPPPYSTDIAAAMEVFENFAPCASLYHHGPTKGGHWSVYGNDKNGDRRIHAEAPTAALAICRAALLATLGGQRESDRAR